METTKKTNMKKKIRKTLLSIVAKSAKKLLNIKSENPVKKDSDVNMFI